MRRTTIIKNAFNSIHFHFSFFSDSHTPTMRHQQDFYKSSCSCNNCPPLQSCSFVVPLYMIQGIQFRSYFVGRAYSYARDLRSYLLLLVSGDIFNISFNPQTFFGCNCTPGRFLFHYLPKNHDINTKCYNVSLFMRMKSLPNWPPCTPRHFREF